MRDSILRRVAALSADARAVIQAAAVVEVPAREELLRRAAGLTRARTGAALCEALGAAILVVADGAYRLCHALAAHAIRETIALPERQRLHLRVARALEAADEPVPLAQLAYHYRQGGDQQRWLRYAERAADAYMAVGEDCEGTSYLIDALTAPGLARATRTTLALKLGEAALFGRVPGGAIEALRRVLNDASLPRGVRGEIRYSLGRLLFEVVDVRGGQSELTRAAEDLRGRPGLRARALARLAASPPSPGQPLDRRRLVEEAVEAAAQVQDPALRTEVIGTRAYVLLTSGDPAGWEAERTLPRDARSIGHKLELVRTCKHLASAACTLGHYERARALLAEAEGLRHELGHERFAVGLATVRAQLDWNTGRWTGLEERARRLVEASPHTPLMARASKLVVAWLLLCRGAVREAEQDLGHCSRHSRTTGCRRAGWRRSSWPGTNRRPPAS